MSDDKDVIQDEWRAFVEISVRPWLDHVSSLERGELERLRNLDKIDRAIEFDNRGKFVETMRFHRERFAAAMSLIVEHNTTPKTADELQAAAIVAVYSAYVIGVFAENPEDIAEDFLSKELISLKLEPRLHSARRRQNNRKSVQSNKKKAKYREDTLVRICLDIQKSSRRLSNRELAEKASYRWPDDRPLSVLTMARKISRLRREGVLQA